MMSRKTGSSMLEIEHIRQSLQDIITTPMGTRVMRRNYGTLLADLLDQPITEGLFLKCYSTIYSGILQWEPRIQVSQISISELKSGKMTIDIECVMSTNGQAFNLNIPVAIGATL